MVLKELEIHRTDRWSNDITPLVGTVKFVGDKGEMTLNLNEETARKILDVVAEQLVATSREMAANMTADIIQQVPALENRSGD